MTDGQSHALAIASDAMHRYLVDPDARDDPYEMFATLRRLDPIHCSPSGAYVITRYDDVCDVLRDPRWSRWEAAQLEMGEAPETDGEVAEAIDVMRRMMLHLDDPDHARIRRLMSKAFTPKAIESWKPRVRDVTVRLIDAVKDKDHFDVLHEVGFPLPEIVICELLGVPVEDHHCWKEWIDIIVAANRMSAMSNEEQAPVHAASVELTRYFSELCELRRRDPREDLVSVLVQVESDGERLDRQELVSAIIMLVAGGHETTANLIANGMLCLLRDPAQYRALRDDSSLVPSALEEMLRYEGPARHPLPRRATCDIDIGGATVPAGAIGLTFVNSANRDADHFDDPEAFDIRRAPNNHIAFGLGGHYCLGAALARVEATTMFAALVTELPELQLVAEPAWRPNFLRSLHGLEVAPAS